MRDHGWSYRKDILYILYVLNLFGQISSRPHTTSPYKVAFWKGNPLISGKSRFVKYYNLARCILKISVYICILLMVKKSSRDSHQLILIKHARIVEVVMCNTWCNILSKGFFGGMSSIKSWDESEPVQVIVKRSWFDFE